MSRYGLMAQRVPPAWVWTLAGLWMATTAGLLWWLQPDGTWRFMCRSVT